MYKKNYIAYYKTLNISQKELKGELTIVISEKKIEQIVKLVPPKQEVVQKESKPVPPKQEVVQKESKPVPPNKSSQKESKPDHQTRSSSKRIQTCTTQTRSD